MVTYNFPQFTKDHWGTVPIGWCLLYFQPPDMARIAIRVLGQCQKHGASLADDIAKWCFARFFLRPFFGSRSAHLAAPSDHHYEHTLFHTCQMKNQHADVSIYREAAVVARPNHHTTCRLIHKTPPNITCSKLCFMSMAHIY